MRFSEFMGEHLRGALDDEMTEAIDEVAQAVMLLDKNGSVTLTLKMEKNGGRLIVAGEVKAKAPEPVAEAGLYFLGDDGLSKDDPLQQTLFDSKKYDPETGERIED